MDVADDVAEWDDDAFELALKQATEGQVHAPNVRLGAVRSCSVPLLPEGRLGASPGGRTTLEELNDRLWACCIRDLDRTVAGQTERVGARL
jgi:hypothetical protein